MKDFLIADLFIVGRFRVYDRTTGHFIYSFLDLNEPGDCPPDVQFLPVLSVRAEGNVLYIETAT